MSSGGARRRGVRADERSGAVEHETLRGLTIGNAREEGCEVTFASPHLASFREIKIGIDFFSALGRLQMGNCVFGFVTTKCEEIYVSGASVYIEEIGKAKNFRIMRKKEKEAVVVEAPAPAEEEVGARRWILREHDELSAGDAKGD